MKCFYLIMIIINHNLIYVNLLENPALPDIFNPLSNSKNIELVRSNAKNIELVRTSSTTKI